MSTAFAKLSAVDYLRFERSSNTKHEYHAGEITEMVGASLRHARIVTNLVRALSELLSDQDADVLSQTMRVRVAASDLYTYPDVIVVNGSPELEDNHNDTLLNPSVIFEVLSPSTEAYDRGPKFGHFRQIPSIREYILVSQYEPAIDHFVRDDSGRWLVQDGCSGIRQSLSIPCLSLSIPLSRIYHKIRFDETP